MTMGESFDNAETVRAYLLGRVSDEAALEAVEELLFTDEEFFARVEMAEDELINDYVLGYLDDVDAASFKASLEENPDRLFKLRLANEIRRKALAERAASAAEAKEIARPLVSNAAPPFLTAVKAFFGRPLYVGASAALVVAALAASVYLFGGGGTDELAELRRLRARADDRDARLRLRLRAARAAARRHGRAGHAPTAPARKQLPRLRREEAERRGAPQARPPLPLAAEAHGRRARA
jgi:hypothetical protein